LTRSYDVEVADPSVVDATLDAHLRRLDEGRIVGCEIWLVGLAEVLSDLLRAEAVVAFVEKLEQIFDDVGVSGVRESLQEAGHEARLVAVARRQERRRPRLVTS
jgi:hypothetical protein